MLKKHVPESMKTFKCETCGKAFSRKSLLNSHGKTYHIKHEDRQFECYHCGGRYNIGNLIYIVV